MAAFDPKQPLGYLSGKSVSATVSVCTSGHIVKLSLTTAAFFATSLLAAPVEASDPVDVYQCMYSGPLPEGGPQLTILKSFRKSGAVNSKSVWWEDNGGSAVVEPSNPGDRVFVSLRWPGDHRIPRPDEAFDWSQGSITMNLLVAQAAENFRLEAGEEWRQVVVDRNDTVTVSGPASSRLLALSPIDALLVSDFGPTSTPGRLNMSLDAFLAWGSGARRITVYETRIRPGKPDKTRGPALPVARRRIIGDYDVNISALAQTVASIRDAAQRWEAGLSTSWRQCRRTTEGGDIAITNANRR